MLIESTTDFVRFAPPGAPRAGGFVRALPALLPLLLLNLLRVRAH